MTFSALENRILHDVLQKPQTTSHLLDTYVGKRGVSRAGLYKALASLKRKEVLLVKTGFVTVNKIWLANSYQFFKRVARLKQEPSYLAQRVYKLEAHEELSYRFSSLADIDLFLVNLIYDLLLLSPHGSVLIEESHEFFLLLNSTRTARFMNEIEDTKHALYLLVHSSSPTDKELIRDLLPAPAQGYVTGTDRVLSSVMHAVGDIVIELIPNKSFVATVRKEYEKTQEMDQLRQKIQLAAERAQSHRIRVYRDSMLTSAMRARFGKHFVCT